jgi:hypothetical protein
MAAAVFVAVSFSKVLFFVADAGHISYIMILPCILVMT